MLGKFPQKLGDEEWLGFDLNSKCEILGPKIKYIVI
jgi:hypothetical protein